MSKRSKRKNVPRVPQKPVGIEEGMQRVKKLVDATKKGYQQGWDEGYEKGRAEATEFSTYVMCPALALALHDLYGFGKKRTCRALNLAGKYMIEAFTSRELIAEAYKRCGFEFDDDPLTGNLVEFDDEKV